MNIDGFALVTGAGSGIGRDCAFAYSAEGAAGVAFADIDEAAAQAAAEESEAFAANPAYRTIHVRVDVSDEESVDDMVRRTVEAFGRVDYGVNSAGVSNISFDLIILLRKEALLGKKSGGGEIILSNLPLISLLTHDYLDR